MRKILIVLLSMLLITGCTKDNEPTQSNGYQMDTIDVDMTIYHGMPFSGHAFKGITMQSFFDLMDNKGSAIIFIGYSGCGACQIMAPVLNQAAKETNTTIYYLDAQSYNEEEYDKYIEIAKDFLQVGEDNEPAVYTPSVMLVNDGIIIDNYIGLKDIDANGSLTKEEEKKGINMYKELLNQLNK